MNILITGATGFIGRNLTKRLINDGHNIEALLRQNSDTSYLPKSVAAHSIPDNGSDLEELLVKNKFDGIIHLATFFTPAHTKEDIPFLINANIEFGTRLLDAATKTDIPWFINIGTFSQHSGENHDIPGNLYSATKQAFADIVKFYAAFSQIDILTLELFNTFGQGDTRKKIFNLWDSISRSGETIDMSPGEQIIDISHIDNIIDGICHAITLLNKDKNLSLKGKVFSLPSSERMTLKELAVLFAEVTNRQININFGAIPYRPLEIMNPIQGESLPGWTSKISLREGIRKTFVD